jgi:hypothetical protein
LYNDFRNIFANKDPSTVIPSHFDAFLATLPTELYKPPENRSMFWGDASTEAYQLSREFDNYYYNIRDTFIGKIADSLTFCGCTTPSSTCIDGIDYGQTCPEQITNSTVTGCTISFWSALSARFAQTTTGKVNILLIPSSGTASVYHKDSIFAQSVLPNIATASVSHIRFLMIRNKTDVDSCSSGSTVAMFSDLKIHFGDTKVPTECVDDFDKVHEYLCADDPSGKECIFVKQYEDTLGRVTLSAIASLAGGYVFGVLSTLIFTFIFYMSWSRRSKRNRNPYSKV